MRFMFHLHLNLQKAFFFRLKHLHDNWHQKMGCRRCYQEVNCDEIKFANMGCWVRKFQASQFQILEVGGSHPREHQMIWVYFPASQWLLENPTHLTSSNSKSAGKRCLEVVLIEEIQLTTWDAWNYVNSGSTYRPLEDWNAINSNASKRLTHLGTIYLSSFSSLLVNDFINRKSKIEGWHPAAHIIASLLAAKKQRFRMQISF